MQIDFANLNLQYRQYQAAIDANIKKVLDSSSYILGAEVAELEQQLQTFTNMQFAITCSSGNDALTLAMLALGIEPGDEIITTPFSFISTAETIALLRAKPVFVDVQEHSFNIDPTKIKAAISDRTKAITAVSLYGLPADMNDINQIAKTHQLKVIIDGAQCFGSSYLGKNTAHYGDIYTTSFFPAKPLGCYGDGGALLTNFENYAQALQELRVHGQHQRYHHRRIGITGRLDTLQAAVLLAKLPHYQDEIQRRQQVAKRYNNHLKAVTSQVKTPQTFADRSSVWAQYTVCVDQRDELQQYLNQQGVPSAIHYPKPLHQQECFEYLGYAKGDLPIAEQFADTVISLPMNPFLTEEQIDFISEQVITFFNQL